MEIENTGVIGAGVMGAQIAYLLARADMAVTLVDVQPEPLVKAMASIEAMFEGAARKGELEEQDIRLKLLRIRTTQNPAVLADAALVIETVPEKFGAKAAVLQQLDEILLDKAVIVTTAWTILVSRLAALTKRPAQVVGMNFFSPVQTKDLVEVVPGAFTSQAVRDTALEFVRTLGKQPLLIGECAGFLVNRLVLPYLLTAVRLWEAGVAGISEIDRSLRDFGFAAGPFETADSIGIDTMVQICSSLQRSYGPRMAAPETLRIMTGEGWLGNKARGGFYRGRQARDQELREKKRDLGGVWREPDNNGSPSKRDWLPGYLVLPIINEAAACLQEGIAYPNEIDYAMKAGAGFPVALGGPLRYADRLGLDKVYQGLEELARVDGMCYWPHYLIQIKKAAGMLGVSSRQGFYAYPDLP